MHSVSRSSMHFMRPLRLGATGAACALVLFAADFWKTKDASQWTSEEINKVLSDSPWARGKTVQPEQSQMRRGVVAAGAAEAGSAADSLAVVADFRAVAAADTRVAAEAAVIQAGSNGGGGSNGAGRVPSRADEPDHSLGQRVAGSTGPDAPEL